MSLVSKAEFARRMKVSRQYIGKLVKSGSLPAEPSGLLDLEKSEIFFNTQRQQNDRNNQQWNSEQKKKGAAKASQERGTGKESNGSKIDGFSVGQEYQRARTAGQVLKIRKDEIELKLLEGKVIRVDSVKNQIEFISSTIRTRLNKFPSKYAARLVGLTAIEIEDTLKNGIYEILSEFKDMLADVKKKALKK